MAETFKIQTIQNHDPGWEEEWEKIAAALILPTKENPKPENTKIYSACRRALKLITNKEEAESLLDDFTAWVLIKYQEKVVNQTLFLDFNPEVQKNPLAFLCSIQYLSKIARDFRLEIRSRLNFTNKKAVLSEDGEEMDILDTIPNRDSRDVAEQVFQNQRQELKKRLIHDLKTNLVIQSTTPTIDHYAGLQLYPRLSNSNEEMEKLKKSVREKAASAHSDENSPETLILCEHQKAKEVLMNKIQKCENVFASKSEFKAREKARREKANHWFALYLCPLNHDTAAAIYDVSNDAVRGWLVDYKKNLPRILGDYFHTFEEATGYESWNSLKERKI